MDSGTLSAILLVIAGLLLYFAPSIISRGKKNSDGILLLNLFLGWTFIGWVGALIWATCSPKKELKSEESKQKNMKCNKCNILYDDTWGACLNCGNSLVKM